jgi:hypothetical protein
MSTVPLYVGVTQLFGRACSCTPGFSSEHVFDVGLVVLDQHVRILSEPRSLVQRHLLDAPDSRLSVVSHGEGTDLVGDTHEFIV